MKKLLIAILMLTNALIAYPPAGTFHDIAVDFQGTFSSLERLVFDTCQPTYINQTNVGTTGVVLGSGIFKLNSPIEFAPSTAANAITLASDDVILDLQSFAITQTNAQAGVNGIQINPSLSNITIKNGSVNNCTNAGIRVAEGNQEIAIAHLDGTGNARGILFDGTANNPITNSEVIGGELINSTTAVEVINTELTTFQSILALQSMQAAFDIQESFTNLFQDITINGVHNDGSSYGFKLANGGSNQIKNANVTGLSTSSTDTLDKAVGIEIGRNEYNDNIQKNALSTIITSSSARPFGIDMLYSFTAVSNSGLPEIQYDPTVAITTWTRDGRYLAVGGANGNVTVYEFQNNTLEIIASFSIGGGVSVEEISWSPDGKYLAAGGVGGTLLEVREFTGVSLNANSTYDFGEGIYSIDWSPCGALIALGGRPGAGAELEILSFDESNGINSTPLASVTFGEGVRSVNWTSDTRYLAVGIDSGSGDTTRVYSFNGTALTLVASFNLGDTILSVRWSPDNKYLGIGGEVAGAFEFAVLSFSGTSLIQIAARSSSTRIIEVAWSPDGEYLAVGANTGGGNEFQVYQFTGQELIFFDSFGTSFNVFDVNWHPNGSFIAVGSVGGTEVRIFKAFNFPSGHLISNNQIDTINGAAVESIFDAQTAIPAGRGIQAGSENNTIESNLLTNNNLSYTFVTQQLFENFLINSRLRNQFANPLSNVCLNSQKCFAQS